jgi:hypothetical protein
VLRLFPAKAPERRRDGKPGYHLRCWQKAGLLFDKNEKPEFSVMELSTRNATKIGGQSPEKLAVGPMQALERVDAFGLLKRRL